MTKVLIEIYRNDDPEDAEPWAWNLVPNAQVLPVVGEYLLFRSFERGDHNAVALHVAAVTPLASLDGFRVVVRVDQAIGDPLFLQERRLRRDLLALDWAKVGPARRVDPMIDEEDYDGLHEY